jgi:hypothetical protein
MRILWVALAALSMSSCSGKAKAAQCEKDARELGALLTAADTGPEPLFVDNADLVERSDLKPESADTGPALRVAPSELRLSGMPLPDFDAVTSEMTRSLERRKQLYVNHPERVGELSRVVFVVDKATPWSRVVAAVAAAAKAGHDRPSFAFAAPSQTTPPPRAPIDDKLDAIIKDADAANKASQFAQLISGEIKECKPLADAFGSVAAVEPTDKAKSIIAAIPPALIACKCQVHMGNFRSAMYRLMANPKPTRLLVFDPAAPKTRIALPAATTWEVASKKFGPDLRNATLAVE